MRIVIAEDAAVIREGLVQLLADRGLEVVAAVADAEALLAAVDEHRPDVVIADIRMPPTHRDEGLVAAVELRRRHPGLGVLLFSQYIETRYTDRLLADGPAGIGYLLKDRVLDVDEFVAALHRIAEGGTALDPQVVSQLLGSRSGLGALTARELQTLELMAEGLTNTAIARRMDITQRAVEKHVAAIFTKLRLERGEDEHRRILAVLHYLRGSNGAQS
ncbi:response regulator transcription factor [Streptomyces indicus]|uniref:DNA-binding response regulator, NarL/FixJ family, contains REC and HTH domains n=1 Tax=Streptomyces indicus TaxID=417292 RepID=A0A1G8XN49_9ACTN|nr:response regulator transcription factor [Streptomyces indicus]SDJ91856.1 DNA-binding response regulator, NarL/FixJ family, contains REC and HTH domains [Streptomyces indicus]